MPAEIKLLPHTLEAVVTSASEIPEGVKAVHAPELWEADVKGQGVIIAVLDTGISAHPDLAGQVIDGKDFTGSGSYTDGHGHGTHVAGTIAATANGSGVVGVAPAVKLLIGKVLDDNGEGSYTSIISGIYWAADWRGPNGERASIISLSLGGPTDSAFLRIAIQYAVNSGVLVVCAAGNEGDGNDSTNEYAYPGSYPEVVSVGAFDTVWSEVPRFSNSNGEVDLVTPGSGILSTYLNGGYAKLSGTSMATPHVAAGAALILQQFRHRYGRDPSEAELYAQLIRRAQPVSSNRNLEGNGLLNLLLDSGKPDPSTVDLRTAIEALAKMPLGIGNETILDSPEFWLNLLDRYNAGLLTNEDFAYVALAFKKFYVSKL